MSYSAQRVLEKRDPDTLQGNYGFKVITRMSGEGVVTISANRLLEIADQLKRVESDLRKLGLNGFSTQPPKPRPQPKRSGADAMPVDFHVSFLDWKKSNKMGGGSAGPSTPWAWTHGYIQDSPDPRPECSDLVNAILRYGVVQCGRYKIKLSGRDGRLLNRTFA